MGHTLPSKALWVTLHSKFGAT